jgi:hypothetical protein
MGYTLTRSSKHDAKVAIASPAQAPEQLVLVFSVDVDHAPVGRD